MEILRFNNSTSLSASFSGLNSSSTYTLDLDDLITSNSYSTTTSSNNSGIATFTLPSYYLTYTGSLAASVKDDSENIVSITNIDIIRPYCDINSIASALSIKTSEAIEYERIARYIIDSHTGEFTYMRKQKEFVGDGSDELLIDEPIHNLYKVYENEQLMYDSTLTNNQVEYKINKQLNSIVVNIPEGTNRINYPKVWRDRFLDVDFFDGYEYLIDADFGWRVIPQDIQEASQLLIQDIVDDNLRYVNKYIESFDNDDFKIKFSKNWTATTGNRIVDRILEKHQKSIRVGVL